jgi:hypothetical protein
MTCFEKTHYLAGGMCIAYSRDTCKTFNEKKDLCTECETGKYYMSHHVCEEYTVKNCKTFVSDADECEECQEGKWYLKEGICVHSTEVEKCETYSRTEDACSLCEDGFYLASESECRRNPSGLYKCIEYKDEVMCTKCELGFYLDNNYCQKSKVIIENCANYTGEGECEICLDTHLLLENVCVEKIEDSCSEWEDAENCSKCPENQVLKTNDDSKKQCVDSEIEGCVEAEANSPKNKCIRCQNGKILVDDACQDPENMLTGCKVYVQEGECLECEDNYTLTKSKNGCVANFTLMAENCSYGVEEDSPMCRVCMSGYHLNESRECVSCGGEGCDVCDPYDSTKCLFCKPGFDHDASGCSAPMQNRASSIVADQGGVEFKFISRVNGILLNLMCFFALIKF